MKIRHIAWDANGRAHALRFGDYGLVWRLGRLWVELHYYPDGLTPYSATPEVIFAIGPFIRKGLFVTRGLGE